MRRLTAHDVDLALAALEAAWPFPKLPEASEALYRARLRELNDADALGNAVRALIDSEGRFPPIAAVLDQYVAEAKLLSEERAKRGLPEHDLSTAEHARLSLRAIEGQEGPLVDGLRAVFQRVAAKNEEGSR